MLVLGNANAQGSYSEGNAGYVDVSGVGAILKAEYFTIGTYGIGAINIRNGGTMVSVPFNPAAPYCPFDDKAYYDAWAGGDMDWKSTIVGYGANSTGAINVTGTGSSWQALDAYIGRMGNGTLDISSGGTVTGKMFNVGTYAGSYTDDYQGIIRVTGTGSSLSTDDVYIGDAGKANQTVTGGGSVREGNYYFGNAATGNGDASISGAGTTFAVNTMTVGVSGKGKVDIRDGASVAIGGGASTPPLLIAKNAGSVGVLEIGAASLTSGIIQAG